MISAIIVIVGISVLILLHELGHFIAARRAGLLVEEFGFGFPPRMFGIKRGETTYSFNWLPFGGFVKIYGESKEAVEARAIESGIAVDTKRSFAHQGAWPRTKIILAGVAVNFVLGWLLLSMVFMIGAAESVVITGVQANSPAELAGLLPGDELVGFDKAEEFTAFTKESAGKQMTLMIRRDEQEIAITATPRLNPEPGQGALGVGLSQTGFEQLSFLPALWEGFTTSFEVMWQILRTFGAMIAGLFARGELLEGVVGPVGIFGVAGDLGALGVVYLLQMIALISLNLTVLNALPFPALDGGRFLFVIIEKLKGSAISPKRELIFNLTGFGFLLLLMLLITVRDVVRLF